MTYSVSAGTGGDSSQAQPPGLESLLSRAAAVTSANRQLFARRRSALRAVESAKTGSTSSTPTSGSSASGGGIKV